jgi:hypothetical protein
MKKEKEEKESDINIHKSVFFFFHLFSSVGSWTSLIPEIPPSPALEVPQAQWCCFPAAP